MKIVKLLTIAALVGGAFTFVSAAAPENIFKRCTVCHGKQAEKVPPGGTVITAKLSAEEIKKSLNGYKSGTYGGKMKASMTGQVKSLSNEDIDALGDYIFKNFHIEK
jgi:cytochrome c553